MCTMSYSCPENADHVSKMHACQFMRNASSLSTESSEFEFDFNDEPPLSPKLLYSPNFCPNYTPNHFPNGETVFKASVHQYSAERDSTPNHFTNGVNGLMASTNQHCAEGLYKREGNMITSSTNYANLGQNGLISSFSAANSEGEDGNAEIKGALNDGQQGLRGQYEHISVDNHTGNDNYKAYASVSMANYDVNGGRKTTNLRSLLNRRDLEQLPPLTNYGNYPYKKEIISASAISPSSSPLNYHANHSSNPCKLEDNHPDYAGEAGSSSPERESKSSQKKCRKWAFKLDFLKKSPSPRADPALVRQSSNDNHAGYAPNHSISTNQLDQCSITDEAGFDNDPRDRECNAAANAGELAGISHNDQLNQRIDHYRAAAAASEARFNRLINHSINDNYRAAAADHYRVAPAAVITKYESPRQSTCSVVSSVSSSPKQADNYEVIRANHKKISRSAPISPAASPPRGSSHAAGDQGTFTRRRPPTTPMSPHALHYQQQKARTDELRRKTFLPYRQSLLGACFFPLSTHPQQAHPHHPQQAVY